MNTRYFNVRRTAEKYGEYLITGPYASKEEAINSTYIVAADYVGTFPFTFIDHLKMDLIGGS